MRAGLTLIGILCLATSCSHSSNSIEGKWVVSSLFHKATYEIVKHGKTHSALILMYDDGTTKFNHDPSKPNYLFKSMRKRKGIYVDAMSGATKSKNPKNGFQISARNIDTLQVDQFIKGKSISEVWTRKKH